MSPDAAFQEHQISFSDFFGLQKSHSTAVIGTHPGLTINLGTHNDLPPPSSAHADSYSRQKWSPKICDTVPVTTLPRFHSFLSHTKCANITPQQTNSLQLVTRPAVRTLRIPLHSFSGSRDSQISRILGFLQQNDGWIPKHDGFNYIEQYKIQFRIR